MTPREEFLAYVRSDGEDPHIVSPFLPHEPVIQETLSYLGEPVTEDRIVGFIKSGQRPFG